MSIAPPTAVAGCLAYLATLPIMDAATLAGLRQRLHHEPAATVAESLWTTYHAMQDSDDPQVQGQLYMFGEYLEELIHTIERLATEPAAFMD